MIGKIETWQEREERKYPQEYQKRDEEKRIRTEIKRVRTIKRHPEQIKRESEQIKNQNNQESEQSREPRTSKETHRINSIENQSKSTRVPTEVQTELLRQRYRQSLTINICRIAQPIRLPTQTFTAWTCPKTRPNCSG